MLYRNAIVNHPGRIQPYTVWLKGEVLFFSDSLEDARDRMHRELLRLKFAEAA